MANILLLGCGYVGSQFATICHVAGHRITALSRTPDRLAGFTAISRVVPFDWSDSTAKLPLDLEVDIVICCISHRVDPAMDPRSNDHQSGLAHVLQQISDLPERIIYLSTTGVYANQQQGEWIDEDSFCQPDRPGTQNAYRAERWLLSEHPRQAIILRPAGIYGPGRIPNLNALRAGEPISADPDSYLNLIHVYDLASVIHHIIQADRIPHNTYNVADGHPVLRRDYYHFISQSIGAPEPNFSTPSVSQRPALRARSQGSKRIRTIRLTQDFSYTMRYPSYILGLPELLNC